eukprot:5077212-Prymnesium_polylepis.1
MPSTKPAWRARLAIGSGSNSVVATVSHRASGTSPTASHPHATRSIAARCDTAPAGSNALVPSTTAAKPVDTGPGADGVLCVACAG